MPEQTNCHPPPDRLRAFGLGGLTKAESSRIEDHLQVCAACVDRLAQIGADPFVELVCEAAETDLCLTSSRPNGASATVVPSGYELLEPIGRGGMGVVFKARQIGMQRLVALKQVRSGLDASPSEIQRFLKEVEAVARLQHPNIVQIFDVGQRDHVPYFAMEYLPGGSLVEKLIAGPLPDREAARLVEHLAIAIDHAHEAGVIHRDLKPGNILFNAEGIPKLVDFGLAKRLDDNLRQTHTGTMLGTPCYMAPEQADGKPVGPATDIHALGVILYECVTGKRPYEAETTVDTLTQVRMVDPTPPSKLRSGLARDLQTICLKCLEKDPRRRYGSAQALAQDLARFQCDEPICARPVGRAERTIKWARRNPSKAALAFAAGLAAIGAIVGLLAHQSRLQVEIVRTQAAARQANEEKVRADANYRQARAAIQQMFAHFTDADVTNSPGLSELHSRQAENALAFYEGVLRQAPTEDPTMLVDTAKAFEEAGTIQIALGRLADADRNVSHALELLDQVATHKPNDPEGMAQRLSALQRLGFTRSDRSIDEVDHPQRRALAIAEQLVRLDPKNSQFRAKLAWCLHNLASSYLLTGRAADAEPHQRRAVELYRALASEQPDSRPVRLELAESLINLGLAESAHNQFEQAIHTYKESSDLLRAHANDGALSKQVWAALADLAINWGNAQRALGRVDEAITTYDDGLARVAKVIALEPNVPRYRTTELNLHASKAQALERQGTLSQSADEWAVAANLAKDSDRHAFLIAECLVRARAGHHVPTRIRVDRLANQSHGDLKNEEMYNLACVYALCARAAERDELLDSNQRAFLVKENLQVAFAWLRDSVHAGLLDNPAYRELVLTDQDLSALSGRPEFQALIKRAAPTNGDKPPS